MATVHNQESEAEESAPVVVRRQGIRSKQLKQRRRKRRVVIFQAVLSVIFLAALIALLFAGYRLTMQLTGGQIERVTDPNAPNFTAEVTRSVVELIAFIDTEEQLATTLLVTQDHAAETRSISPLPSKIVVWEFEEAEIAGLDQVFAEGGIDELASRIGADLGVGITDTRVMPMSMVSQWAEQVGDISFRVPDNLISLDNHDEVVYHSGTITLTPEEVAPFFEFVGYLESRQNSALRHLNAWEALFSAASEQNLPDISDEWTALGEEGTMTQLAAIATAPGTQFDLLPFREVPLYQLPPESIFGIDNVAIGAWQSRYVPKPTSAFPGQRTSVALLNGTNDNVVMDQMLSGIVAANGELALIGNADSFDVAASRIEYSQPLLADMAAEMGAALGITEIVEVLDSRNVDLTVIIGADFL